MIYWKQRNINQEEAKSLLSFCNFLELYFCLFKAYHFKFWQWYRQIVPDRYSSNVEKTEEGSVTCKNLCNTLTCSRSYTVYLIYPSLKFMSIYMYYQHAKIQQSQVFFAHSAGTLYNQSKLKFLVYKYRHPNTAVWPHPASTLIKSTLKEWFRGNNDLEVQ